MKKIPVELKTNPYNIYVDTNLLSSVPDYLQKINTGKNIVIITDDNVDQLYSDQVIDFLKRNGYSTNKFVIHAGEQYKSQSTISNVYDWMLQNHFSRDITIIALGGGVVGDLAGFVAATYMRGVGFIQVPTTLLAQVDSSVGGKVGINHQLGKNVIGTFYQPKLVIIDPLVLKTLPKRELCCGLAEVIKYGLILDADLFIDLQQNFDNFIHLDDWHWIEEVISKCCYLKSMVVQQDEKESGLRRILNFGHTIGHALESVTNYSYFTHGEAIAWGMVAAAEISLQKGYICSTDFQQIVQLINKIKKPSIPAHVTNKKILESILIDKKVTDLGLHFVLLENIGKAIIELIDKESILSGIRRILRVH